MKRKRIFISYRRRDSAGYAGRIKDSLVQRFGEDRVFLDVDEIAPGSDFEARIRHSIDQSAVIIAVIGKDWLKRESAHEETSNVDSEDYIHFELLTALENKVPVVPVLVGDVEMPESGQLQDDIAGISRLNAFRLSDLHWQRDIDVLARSLRLSYQVPPSRLNRMRNVALSFALVTAALLVLSLLIGVVNLDLLRPMVETLCVPALIGYLVLVAWMARFTGGSRIIAMSVLAGLAVHLKVYGASGLALFVLFGSVLLFRDIESKDEKSERRLVDRYDYLLEGSVLGAAIGSVLILIPLFYVFDSVNSYQALGPGLIFGAMVGFAVGLYRYRHKTNLASPDK